MLMLQLKKPRDHLLAEFLFLLRADQPLGRWCLQMIRRGPPTLGRAVCFTQSSLGEIFILYQKKKRTKPHRNVQNYGWLPLGTAAQPHLPIKPAITDLRPIQGEKDRDTYDKMIQVIPGDRSEPLSNRNFIAVVSSLDRGLPRWLRFPCQAKC